MTNYHTRVIALNYTPEEVPQFSTAEEKKEWYAAIGYMVAYGLHTPDNGPGDHSMGLVNLYFSNEPTEINAGYFKPVLQERHEDGGCRYRDTPEDALDQLKEKLVSSPTPFVIGAVLDEDGKWGFHS